MFEGYGNSLTLQILLGFLIIQQIDSASSYLEGAIRPDGVRSEEIAFQPTTSLEKRKVNHNFLRNYVIGKGLSDSLQFQPHLQAEKTFTLIQRREHKKKEDGNDIDDVHHEAISTYNTNPIRHFDSGVAAGKAQPKEEQIESFPTSKQAYSTDIPVSSLSVRLSELAKRKVGNIKPYNLAQEKGSMDLLENTRISGSLKPHLKYSPAALNSISAVYGSSKPSSLSLTTRKYKLTQHETSSSSSLDSVRLKKANSGMQAKNFDVSFMKSESKSKNGGVKVKKRLEMGAASFSSDLFLAAKSKPNLYNAILHFKRSNSSPKSVGNKIMKADVQSGGTTDTSAEQRSARARSYLSKEKSGRKEEENGKNSDAVVSNSKSVATFPPDVNAGTDLAVVNAASAVITGEKSESFTQNGSCNNSNGTTQQMAQITETAEREVGKRGNRNFTLIVAASMTRQKRNLDRYPRFATSAYPNGDQQTRSYAKDQSGGRMASSSSSAGNNESGSGKVQEAATFSSGGAYNLTQRKITQGLSFPISSSAATAVVKPAFTEVALVALLQRPKVGKIAARVLESESGEQTNNIHLQTGTKTKTSSSSVSTVWTRNCSALKSLADNQPCSSDGERTENENEMPLAQMEDSFERNKSRIGNVNDSLTSSSLGCKCQIKQRLHFKFPQNSSAKLALNPANISISSSKSIETSAISSSSTATERNQLAKLDTLITTTSFELEKVVGTKAKSISTFDKSFDKMTQTISTMSKEKNGGNEQTKRLLYYRHHPRHANKRFPSTTRNDVWEKVKRRSIPFLGTEDYSRRLRRDTLKENKLLRNFDHLHQTEFSRGKKLMLGSHPPNSKPVQNFKQMTEIQNFTFETAPGIRKEPLAAVVSQFDGALHQTGRVTESDIDLPKMNTDQHARQNLKYFTIAKTTDDFIPNKELNSRHHENNDDAYHLQNETQSSRIYQNFAARIDYHNKEKGKFLLQKGNIRESMKPNSSSPVSRIFLPKTLSVENKSPASSSLLPPCATALLSKCDIKKSDVTVARSLNGKRNLLDEMKMKTAQGYELLASNLAFTSRSSSVNGRQQNAESSTMRDGVRAAVLRKKLTNTTTPINWRNANHSDHDSDNSTDMGDRGGITTGSDLGKNDRDALLRFRQKTPAISRLVAVLHRKKFSAFSNAKERVRPSIFNEKAKPKLLQRIKRDTRCAITTREYATNSSVIDGDGCGTVDLGGTVAERQNLTRKLIPLRENLFFSHLPLTGNERVLSPIMNTNNNRYNNDVNSKETQYYQIAKKVGALLPVSLNSAANTGTPFTGFEKIRLEYEKTTRKTADETEKVLANEYNFLGKQWMSDKVNGWSNSNDNPFSDKKDGSTRKKLSHNSLENELPIMRDMPSSETSVSDVHNSLDYKTTSQVVNLEENKPFRNKLSVNTTKDSLLKISMLVAAHDDMLPFTLVPSSSPIRNLSTLQLEENNEERGKHDTAGTIPLGSIKTLGKSFSLMGGGSMKTVEEFGESMMKKDESEQNAKVDNSAMVGEAESLNGYKFHSFSTTSPVEATSSTINSFPPSSSPHLLVASTETKENKQSEEGTAFTADASFHPNMVGVKATNGFTRERHLSSPRYVHEDTFSTLLIEKSKTDGRDGEPATASIVSAFKKPSVRTVSHIDVAAIGLTELSADEDDGPVSSEITAKPESTTSVPDGTMPSISIASTTAQPNPATTLAIQSESNFPATMSPSEITSTSASVSHENLSPATSPSTETQNVGHTDQPQGTTLMSTPAANLEEAIMLPTTTSATVTVPSDLGNNNKGTSPGREPIATSTDSSAPLPTNPVSQGEGEDSGNKEGADADVQPLECDSHKGMQYSEETKNCVCRAGFQYSEHDMKCINLVGNECVGSGETSNSDCPLNSFCKSEETSSNAKSICTCVSGYIPTTDKSRCMAGWKTECISASMSDISMQNLCHPDFDCAFSEGDTGGKCDCKDNRTIGLPSSFEEHNSNITGNYKWKDEQPISCFLDYGSDCDPANDKCNNFRFLKCSQQSAKCECADSNNQLYDERARECVARAGSFCTLAASAGANDSDKGGNVQEEQMGFFLSCIGNSSCIRIGNETNSQFAGTCKCLEGHDQHWQGYCTMKGNSASFRYQCNLILGLLWLHLMLRLELL